MTPEHLKRLKYLETLELPEDATPLEIKASYQSLKSLYTKGSIALTPIEDDCPDEVRKEILKQVEQAYNWLTSNPTDTGPARELREEASEDGATESAMRLPFEHGAEPEVYDGPSLKKIRERLGIELSEVEFGTKISMNHITNIEEEKFSALPEPVFVRGYITAYAKCLRLDPQRVAEHYMERYKKGR